MAPTEGPIGIPRTQNDRAAIADAWETASAHAQEEEFTVSGVFPLKMTIFFGKIGESRFFHDVLGKIVVLRL